jgi:hypothetical protein
MGRARRMTWWLAVPVGIALGLAVAVGIDRAADPAAAQGGRSGFTISAEQLRINQRIGQQGVKRANRANSRLDRLTTGGVGPPGPAGAAGPPGPTGPGAGRIAFSAAVGAPAQGVLDLAGVTITAACRAEAGGGAALDVTFGSPQAGTLVGTVSIATGTDPAAPATEFQNVQIPLAAGATPSPGDPAPDGEFVREFISVLLVTPARTLSLQASLIADAAADRCSFNGVAVPAS